MHLNSDSDAPEVEGAGGEGYTSNVDIRIAYVDLRGRVFVCEDRQREDEGRARRVCSELGAQSRPPDIVGGGAVRESLSIAAEKDERIVQGLVKRNGDTCVSRNTRYLGP